MPPRELPIPPTSQSQERASEVLRAWINADKNLDVILVPAFEDPAVWGVLLVDVARHVSRAFAAEGKYTAREALDRIRGGLDAEWDSPTDVGNTTPMRRG